MSIYLDNSATTAVCENAKEKMLAAINDSWGNPSSFHKKGIQALELLEEARKRTAQIIGAESEEIFFTPGGTFSNNIAILGAVNAHKRKGRKIVTTSVEHPSVENVMKKLESDGFEVVRLSVDENCMISKTDLLNAIDENTILVTVMAVNNEVGSVMPIDFIKKAVRSKNSPALIHCDCVQAFGKMQINVEKLGIDMLSVSSHKINGPKGAGALFLRKGVRILSPISGGGQEKGIAPGTQAMPAIAGFLGAMQELPLKTDEAKAKMTVLRDMFVKELKKIDGIEINSPHDATPYIVNFSVLGIPSQPMINYLSQNGVYVSGGSACSKGHRSRVLEQMKLSPERIDSAIRASFSRFTTKQELKEAVELISLAQKKLKKAGK